MTTRVAGTSLLVFALIAGSVLAGPGCGSKKDDDRTFRIATLTWVGYAPIYLAQEKGFFRGIKVEIDKIDDTAARRAAFISKDVQGSVDIVDSFANAVASGLPGVAVLKLDDSMGGDGIVVKKTIATAKDLKGKTVAYPQGQPSHFFLLSVLESAGLTANDIESRPMEADQAGAAFVSGDVDAAVTWEPWLTRASQSAHGKILTTSRETPGLIVDIFTVERGYFKAHPDIVEAFIRGWVEAVDYWGKHRDESDPIMAKALGLDLAQFQQMVAGVKYADLAGSQAFFRRGADGSSPYTSLMRRASTAWRKAGLIQKDADVEASDGSSTVLSLR